MKVVRSLVQALHEYPYVGPAAEWVWDHKTALVALWLLAWVVKLVLAYLGLDAVGVL